LTELNMNFDWSLLVFFAIVIVAALSGVLFKPGEWYERLSKPSWTPPNWLFGPVWSALYICIAIAGWLIWRTAPSSGAMWLWVAQLVLNAGWSALFFGLRRMDLAFGEVVLLWLSIAGFILMAYAISPVAAALFLPYLVWVTIAATLNFTVWRMNPQEG
jgi:benzodiazapine receptor